MRDMSIPTSIAARHAGPTPGGQTYFPLICSKVSSSSMKKLFHVAFVNANGVAIRIENHRHAANGRLDRFDAELHVLQQFQFVRVFHQTSSEQIFNGFMSEIVIALVLFAEYGFPAFCQPDKPMETWDFASLQYHREKITGESL